MADVCCHSGSDHWSMSANLIFHVSVRMNLAYSHLYEVVLVQLKSEAVICLDIDWFSLVLTVRSYLYSFCFFRGIININNKLYGLMYTSLTDTKILLNQKLQHFDFKRLNEFHSKQFMRSEVKLVSKLEPGCCLQPP